MSTVKEICQDVIDRVKSSKITPLTNYIIDLNNIDRFARNASAQDVLKKITCSVCAKGAVLTSWIIRNNNFLVGQLKSINNCDPLLQDWPEELVELFGIQLLNEIEIAFESKVFDFHYDGDGFSQRRANELTNRYDHLDLSDRLIEIMTDIINDRF